MNWNLKALALAALLLFTGGAGLGQQKTSFQVEGIVRDGTGAPVPNAEVTLSDGRFRATQLTDSEGRFHFQNLPIAAGTLTIRTGVFTPVEQSWDAHAQGSKPMEITLAPKALAERITVTATRTAQRVSDTASSVTVLGAEDLAVSGGITLDDALGEVPGFMLYRRNGSLTANPTSLGVSLRGVGTSGASRALVISDGIPFTDPFGGWVYWDRIPMTSVERGGSGGGRRFRPLRRRCAGGRHQCHSPAPEGRFTFPSRPSTETKRRPMRP